MMRVFLGETRGVSAMLRNQHVGTFGFMGKDAMRTLGLTRVAVKSPNLLAGVDVSGITRGVGKSQRLPVGVDVAAITRGVVKPQGFLAGVDVMRATRGVVQSQDLMNRAGLRDALKDINTGAVRISMPSVTLRLSRATAGLLAASAVSGQDIMRWTSPGWRAEFARIGAATRVAGVNQQLASARLHRAIAAAVAVPTIRDLGGLAGLGLTRVEFSALNHLALSTVRRPRWAEGPTFSNQAALRELTAAAIGRSALSWKGAYSGHSELQRVLRDATRSGLGITGVDVMRGRRLWDGVGVVRAHNALVGVRAPWADYARIADLFGPGVWPDDTEMPSEAELFVPGPGDILDAASADIVTADALDGELVPARRLDVAWEWVCANPGHFVTAWNIVWPDASVHERNALRRQAATIGAAHLGVVVAWMSANPVGFVGALFVLGLAWQGLYDELSKLLSERDEQR